MSHNNRCSVNPQYVCSYHKNISRQAPYSCSIYCTHDVQDNHFTHSNVHFTYTPVITRIIIIMIMIIIMKIVIIIIIVIIIMMKIIIIWNLIKDFTVIEFLSFIS